MSQVIFQGRKHEMCIEENTGRRFEPLVPTTMAMLFFLKQLHICWLQIFTPEYIAELATPSSRKRIIIDGLKCALRNVTTILVGCGGLWLVTRFTGNSLDPLYILGTVCVHHFDKSKLFSFAQILVGGYIVFYTTQSGLALASHFITSTGKENCHPLQRLCLTSPWPAIIADSPWCPVFSVITGIIFWILGTTLFVHVLLKALRKTGYDRFPEVNLPLVKGTFVEALYNCVTFLSWVITGGVLIAAFLFSGQVKGFLIMFAVIIGIFMILVWFSERSRWSRDGNELGNQKDPESTTDLEKASLFPKISEKVVLGS